MVMHRLRKEYGGEAGEGQGEEGEGGLAVELSLAGKDFHHPYTPYKIQEEFMETVYRVLEGGGGRVGILESPTGTVCGLFILLNFVFLGLVPVLDLAEMEVMYLEENKFILRPGLVAGVGFLELNIVHAWALLFVFILGLKVF
jgi:uncharacterized protein YqgC (DUF456 family)